MTEAGISGQTPAAGRCIVAGFHGRTYGQSTPLAASGQGGQNIPRLGALPLCKVIPGVSPEGNGERRQMATVGEKNRPIRPIRNIYPLRDVSCCGVKKETADGVFPSNRKRCGAGIPEPGAGKSRIGELFNFQCLAVWQYCVSTSRCGPPSSQDSKR